MMSFLPVTPLGQRPLAVGLGVGIPAKRKNQVRPSPRPVAPPPHAPAPARLVPVRVAHTMPATVLARILRENFLIRTNS